MTPVAKDQGITVTGSSPVLPHLTVSDVSAYVYNADAWVAGYRGKEKRSQGIGLHAARSNILIALRDLYLQILQYILLAVASLLSAYALDVVIRAFPWAPWVLTLSSIANWALFGLAAIFFFLAWRTYRRSQALQRREGLIEGHVVFSDSPFVSSDAALSGKPDYVVARDGTLVPVEIKSGTGRDPPYDSHWIQVVAYCYLIEAQHGQAPKYGLIQYHERDEPVKVVYNPEARALLLATMAEMRTRVAQGS